MQMNLRMSKKTQPRRNAQEARRQLRTLTHEALQVVSGGNYVPGQFHSSSGGGGITTS